VLGSAGVVGAAPVCEAQSFEGSRFTACAFDSRAQELRLVWKNARGEAVRTIPRLALKLGRDAQRLRFMMNGGMYEADGRPVGLYVEGGRMLRRLNTAEAGGNFYLKPNGVFSLDEDGMMRIETSEAYAARGGAARFATQSGPMLLIGGKLHPQISEDGPSRLIRNGVGLKDRFTAFFVISDDTVSFGKLARYRADGRGARQTLVVQSDGCDDLAKQREILVAAALPHEIDGIAGPRRQIERCVAFRTIEPRRWAGDAQRRPAVCEHQSLGRVADRRLAIVEILHSGPDADVEPETRRLDAQAAGTRRDTRLGRDLQRKRRELHRFPRAGRGRYLECREGGCEKDAPGPQNGGSETGLRRNPSALRTAGTRCPQRS